jgi:hypothetical protein
MFILQQGPMRQARGQKNGGDRLREQIMAKGAILSSACIALLALGVAGSAHAQRMRGPYWPAYGPGFGWRSNTFMASNLRSEQRQMQRQQPMEGNTAATRFIAQGAAAKLRHGAIEVKATQQDGPPLSAPIFEAAVVDQLAKLGYETAKPDPSGGQIAEVQFSRLTVIPEEQKRNPVSGETMIGVSNRGSMFGMALAVDLSKPRKALVSTQMNIRIRDRLTNAVLWEGRATLDTRDGDKKWPEDAIAARLSAALLEHLAKPGQAQEVAIDTQ